MGLGVLENKEPLYCFKLEEESGKIIRYIIPEWDIRNINNYGRFNYIFDIPEGMLKSKSKYYLENNKLDRFVSNKLITFNPDEEEAFQLIIHTLISRRNQSLEYANKLDDMIGRVSNEKYGRKDTDS